jgi:histidinol-phosphate aminotransferase
MSRYWSPLVAGLTPYVAGEQPHLSKLVKLNTNENPFGPSPKVLEALRAACNDDLRLYPDPASRRLCQTLASYFDVPLAQVFVGNGSDEVLALAFQALLNRGALLLFPDITYSFYPVYCRLYGIRYQTIPLTADFRIDIQDYLPQPGRSCSGIIFPNPNAPTGRALARVEIEQLLVENPNVVVVIDEAYVDFGAESVLPLVTKYENLLVVQTLSKSRCLAGLRLGFAIGSEGLIEGMERVKNSFNSYPVDRLAAIGGIAAFDDEDYFAHVRAVVIETRQWLVQALLDLDFEVLPSVANFVLVRHSDYDAQFLVAKLREQGIIVRYFAQPRLMQFFRISVGTAVQCQLLVQALRMILKRGSN